MRARLIRLLAFASVIGLAGSAWPCAAVEYFYKDLPVARMTTDDFKIATPVIRRALDEGAEGQTHTWENPATGASGSVTLRSTPFSRNGTTCRRAEFMTSAGGLRNVSAWTLCKLPEGWKAVE
jgi:surface antigen